MLDYSTVVIPVTKANRNLDTVDPDYEPVSDVDKLNWLACKITISRIVLHSAHVLLDDPDTYDGAPAAVQLLGRRFDEEKLLSIAQLVVDALKACPERR